MWITHFLKVTKFVFEFKWNKKFNSLKALSALRKHSRHDTRASRSISCVHFCNFWIIYMIINNFIFLQIFLKGKTTVNFNQGYDLAFQRLFRIIYFFFKWNFLNI